MNLARSFGNCVATLLVIAIPTSSCGIPQEAKPPPEVEADFICQVPAKGEVSCLSGDYLYELLKYGEMGPAVIQKLNDVYSKNQISSTKNALLQCAGLGWSGIEWQPGMEPGFSSLETPPSDVAADMRTQCKATLGAYLDRLRDDPRYNLGYDSVVQNAISEMEQQVNECVEPYYGGLAVGPLLVAGAAGGGTLEAIMVGWGTSAAVAILFYWVTAPDGGGDAEGDVGSEPPQGYEQYQEGMQLGTSSLIDNTLTETRTETSKSYDADETTDANGNTVKTETWTVTITTVTTTTNTETGEATETIETTTTTWTRTTTTDAQGNKKQSNIVKTVKTSKKVKKKPPQAQQGQQSQGDCFDSMDCATSCQRLREGWAKLKLLCAESGWKDLACVQFVIAATNSGFCPDPRMIMPLPDGSYSCATLATNELIAQARKEFCEEKQGLMHSGPDGEYTMCSMTAPVEFNTNQITICDDPRAYITEDQCLLNTVIPEPYTPPEGPSLPEPTLTAPAVP